MFLAIVAFGEEIDNFLVDLGKAESLNFQTFCSQTFLDLRKFWVFLIYGNAE